MPFSYIQKSNRAHNISFSDRETLLYVILLGLFASAKLAFWLNIKKRERAVGEEGGA